MKYYIEPAVELLYLASEDILTGSDNWGNDIFNDLES